MVSNNVRTVIVAVLALAVLVGLGSVASAQERPRFHRLPSVAARVRIALRDVTYDPDPKSKDPEVRKGLLIYTINGEEHQIDLLKEEVGQMISYCQIGHGCNRTTDDIRRQIDCGLFDDIHCHNWHNEDAVYYAVLGALEDNFNLHHPRKEVRHIVRR